MTQNSIFFLYNNNHSLELNFKVFPGTDSLYTAVLHSLEEQGGMWKSVYPQFLNTALAILLEQDASSIHHHWQEGQWYICQRQCLDNKDVCFPWTDVLKQN